MITFKSWQDVTDSRIALSPIREKLVAKYNEVRYSGYPLSKILTEEVEAALVAPHLTEEGVDNLINSLRAYFDYHMGS